MRKLIISLCFVFTFIIIGIGFLCIDSKASVSSTSWSKLNDSNDWPGLNYDLDFYIKNTSVENGLNFTSQSYTSKLSKRIINSSILNDYNISNLPFADGNLTSNDLIHGTEFYLYLNRSLVEDYIDNYNYHTVHLIFLNFGSSIDDAGYTTSFASNYSSSSYTGLTYMLNFSIYPYYSSDLTGLYYNYSSCFLSNLGYYNDSYIYQFSNYYYSSDYFEFCFEWQEGVNGYYISFLTPGEIYNYNDTQVYWYFNDDIQNGFLLDTDYFFDNGYNSGYNYGLKVGRQQAIENDKDTWIEQGRVIGYSQGYDEASSSNRWFGDGLLRLVDIPFILFNQFLNFEILGINFYYIILALMTLLIAFFIIRKLLR